MLVAFKTLAPTALHEQIQVIIYTDNMDSSYALMKGKTKDSTLGACAHQLWLEAANRHLDFLIKHKPGVEIPLADAHTDPMKAALSDRMVKDRGLTEYPPALAGYTFFDLSLAFSVKLSLKKKTNFIF